MVTKGLPIAATLRCVFLERQGEAQGRLRGARFLVIEDRGSFGLAEALEELPATTIAAYDNVIQKKTFGALILCLGDRILREINKEMTALVGDLAAIDTAISDDDHVLLLLTSLPSSYDNFVETLLYGLDTLKLEDGDIWSERYGAGYRVRGQSHMEEATDSSVIYVSGSGADEYDSADVMMEYDSGNILLGDGGSSTDEGWVKFRVIQRQLCSRCKSGVTKHLGAAGIQQQNGLVEETNVTHWAKVRCILIQSGPFKLFLAEDTTMSTYLVNRSPSSAIGFKIAIDMLKFFGWLTSIRKGMLEPVKVACIFLGYHIGIVGNKIWRLDDVTSKVVLYRNMGFNESGEYKKTFTGSGVCTILVKVLQGVEFEVESRGIMHLREDNNEAAFAVAEVEKIYAHESLTFSDTVTSTVIVTAVTTAKAITKSIHRYVHTSISLYRWYGLSCGCKVEIRVTKGLLDRAKENVLGMEIFKEQSGNTLRVS
nr:hypothetical protein [Tanacetum cinerariifolium]